MPDIPCKDRSRLERAVIVAVEVLYATKREDREAARTAERLAVRGLDEHVKQNGCQGRKT